jgi:hypothetical protein
MPQPSAAWAMADCLQREQRVLHVDKDVIVPGGLGDPGDVAGARDAHIEAKRHLAGCHPFLDRVCQRGAVACGHFHPLLSWLRCRD